MTDQQLRQSEVRQALPWLIVAVLALAVAAYGTGRTVALLSPPLKAAGEPVIILGSAPPESGATEGMWIFALALFLSVLWPLIARRRPVLARRVLIVGVFAALALVFLEVAVTGTWLATRSPIQVILPE